MGKISPEEKASFFRNSDAYIPYTVIGIFILLTATFASAYLLNMDCEIAETIYTTEKSDPRQTAVNLAAADLARCLNYAGMEALEWQGEHPVIQPEGTQVEKMAEDGFSVTPGTQWLEKGDSLQIEMSLPTDVWGRVEVLWKNKDVVLIVKDPDGVEIKNINYGQATGFLHNVSLKETVNIPETAGIGYASLELYSGEELKASDWFSIGSSPIKDLTADCLNRLLYQNYQDEMHTFMDYAINVEPDIRPEQIIIENVNGSLGREINPTGKTYTIYYVFKIPNLNYSFVDLETGETQNRSMTVSTLICSREPLLESLVKEYENELQEGSGPDSASNIVLGAMNLRTFTYGPWQRYANGPLNIFTNPSLASAVNGAALYTQKRVFDSVDPLALTYTTYYNGKVLYEDVGAARGKASKVNSSSFERENGNMSVTYDSLAANKSFEFDPEEGIEKSLEDANTSLDDLSENSKITVAASDYTEGVLDDWVFNKRAWDQDFPDLIHDITYDIYRADVEGQVERDGFNPPDPISSSIGQSVSPRSVSHGTDSVSWRASYDTAGEHEGALVPSYSWSDHQDNSYSKTVSPSITPPQGRVYRWWVSSASVSRFDDVEITNVKVTPSYVYRGNDHLLEDSRTEGYLDWERHCFDWDIKYTISYEIKTKWRINYGYGYRYKWTTTSEGADGNTTTTVHRRRSSGSDSETTSKTDSESLSHTETETENLTIIYHKRPPTGGYAGLDTYSDLIEREYRETNVSVSGTERFDPCCSDAADKYRAEYVNLMEIEMEHTLFPNLQSLHQQTVHCDIPPWLHKVMGEEVLAMLDSIESDDPSFDYSLLENPGRDPTDLQLATAGKLAADLEQSREAYVNKNMHQTPAGNIYTSNDAARYIARNEAYNKLHNEILKKNRELDEGLDKHVLDALDKKGMDTSLLDSVTSGSMSLFNNPAIEKAASALGQDMGIISTITVTGWPESKYNWTENMTLIIDQKPNYLYHDPDFDLRGEYELKDPRGRTIYPLGVRNTCVFTTGISEEIADALGSGTEYVKTETSQQISQSIQSLSEEVALLEQNLSEQGISLDTGELDQEVNDLKRVYVEEMKLRITEEIASEVSANPVILDCITEQKVQMLVFNHLGRLSYDEILNKSSSSELAEELSFIIKEEIKNSNPSVTGDELDAALNRVDTDVRTGISNGICAVTVSRGGMIDACFEQIDSELNGMVNESVDRFGEELGNKVSKKLQKTMKAVPCGLPVLPPHWVFTINVWTYEIVGMYDKFVVTDNDNEVIPVPYFGHKGQRYVRENSQIIHPFKKDENGIALKLGYNEVITFHLAGYATTIVGPGPKGVGDKAGGSTENSTSYENLLFDLGEQI